MAIVYFINRINVHNLNPHDKAFETLVLTSLLHNNHFNLKILNDINQTKGSSIKYDASNVNPNEIRKWIPFTYVGEK